MAEQDPSVRGHEVAAIVETLRGRGATRIQFEHLLGDEPGVEAIRDEIRAHGRDDEPGRANRFAALQRDITERGSAGQRDANPDRGAHKSVHVNSQIPRRVI